MNLTELKKKSIEDLVAIATQLEIENAENLLKQELVFEILKSTSIKNGQIYGQGVLEILPDGFGFLFQVLMIYMYHLHKLEDLVLEMEILLLVKLDHQKIMKNILHF